LKKIKYFETCIKLKVAALEKSLKELGSAKGNGSERELRNDVAIEKDIERSMERLGLVGKDESASDANWRGSNTQLRISGNEMSLLQDDKSDSMVFKHSVDLGSLLEGEIIRSDAGISRNNAGTIRRSNQEHQRDQVKPSHSVEQPGEAQPGEAQQHTASHSASHSVSHGSVSHGHQVRHSDHHSNPRPNPHSSHHSKQQKHQRVKEHTVHHPDSTQAEQESTEAERESREALNNDGKQISDNEGDTTSNSGGPNLGINDRNDQNDEDNIENQHSKNQHSNDQHSNDQHSNNQHRKPHSSNRKNQETNTISIDANGDVVHQADDNIVNEAVNVDDEDDKDYFDGNGASAVEREGSRRGSGAAADDDADGGADGSDVEGDRYYNSGEGKKLKQYNSGEGADEDEADREEGDEEAVTDRDGRDEEAVTDREDRDEEAVTDREGRDEEAVTDREGRDEQVMRHREGRNQQRVTDQASPASVAETGPKADITVNLTDSANDDTANDQPVAFSDFSSYALSPQSPDTSFDDYTTTVVASYTGAVRVATVAGDGGMQRWDEKGIKVI
jgi:hypothetical protein